MGIPVFITGRSGTGKTYSTKYFGENEVCFISVQKPRLPYRKRFEEHFRTDKISQIIQLMKSTDKKVVIIDDGQYLMANEYLRRANEKSYDKFTDIGVAFRNLIDAIDDLDDDVVVYLMWHTDTKDGLTQMKTVGRMVDQYITPEGLSDIVLETAVVDGVYNFMTQNNGSNGVKSPEGMFDSFSIDNNLKFVDDAIRNYYYFEGAKNDAEIKEEAKEHIGEVEPKPRRRRAKVEAEAVKEEKPSVEDFIDSGVTEDESEEVPFDADITVEASENTPKKRTRKRRTEE